MWHRTLIYTTAALLFLTWALLGCSTPPPTASLAPQLAHYTVRIVVSCPNEGTWSGSGVLVSPQGHIVTAYHLVQKAITANECAIEVGQGRRIDEPADLTYRARLVSHDAAMDVALLLIVADRAGRSPEAPFPYAPLAAESPKVGETVHVLGFPSLSEGLLAYDSDTVISVGECDTADTCWLLTEAFASWGSSGGPVFDDRGRLVAVVTGQRGISLGGVEHHLTMARPISAIRDLVQETSSPASGVLPSPVPTRPANVQMDEWQVEVVGPLGANWRSEPSTEKGADTIIDVLPTGTVLHVIPPGEWKGWWATADNQGRIGWVKEKATKVVLLRAYLTRVTPRLSTNREAIVTCLTQAPCAHVRYSPGYVAPDDNAVVGSLPGGSRVEVLEGPYLVDRLVWWRVQGGGINGWLPEVTEEGYRLLAPLPTWK